MKSILLVVLASLLLVNLVHADCGQKDEDDGEVTAWFKNIGCKIKSGAEELGEQTKPWADKIGSAAKDLGHNIAEKFSDVKQKLSDNNDADNKPQVLPVYNAPTEKIPLAPLQKEVPADILKTL